MYQNCPPIHFPDPDCFKFTYSEHTHSSPKSKSCPVRVWLEFSINLGGHLSAFAKKQNKTKQKQEMASPISLKADVKPPHMGRSNLHAVVPWATCTPDNRCAYPSVALSLWTLCPRTWALLWAFLQKIHSEQLERLFVSNRKQLLSGMRKKRQHL